MTSSHVIAFLVGSLLSLVICFIVSFFSTRAREYEVTTAIEDERRKSYARGYEEGNLHGRGQFIARHNPNSK